MNVKFATLAIISKFELIPNTRLVVICLEPLTELFCNCPLADLPSIYRKVNMCNLLLTGVYLDRCSHVPLNRCPKNFEKLSKQQCWSLPLNH